VLRTSASGGMTQESDRQMRQNVPVSPYARAIRPGARINGTGVNDMHVSSYEEVLREGLDKALSELPEDHKQMINKITDTICEAIQESVRYNTEAYLAEAIKDDIASRAAKVAESMLMNAISGDDKTIRNLFGFNDWYMKNLYMGKLPREWALIEAIVERKPDLFNDERFKQKDAQIANLQREVARLKNYWEGYEVERHDGDWVTLRRKTEAA
jgi:hypothetical protein